MIFINFILYLSFQIDGLEETVRYRINVRGRVQGVGFRYGAFREAKRKGITGYVRNMPDGSVFIEAEAPRVILDQFVKWCENGPGSVSSVTSAVCPPEGFAEFTVKY